MSVQSGERSIFCPLSATNDTHYGSRHTLWVTTHTTDHDTHYGSRHTPRVTTHTMGHDTHHGSRYTLRVTTHTPWVSTHTLGQLKDELFCYSNSPLAISLPGLINNVKLSAGYHSMFIQHNENVSVFNGCVCSVLWCENLQR